MLHVERVGEVDLVKLAAFVAASVAAAYASTSSAHQTGPTQAPTRVVDRTVVCRAELSGGIHEVEIRVQSGAVRKGSRWDKPALAMVTTGSTGAAAQALDNAIAWVVAGTPTPRANLVMTLVGFTYPVTTWGTVAMATRCSVKRGARPPLSSKSLQGAFVDPFGTVFDCSTPRRFVVRVRAELTSSSSLRTRRGYLSTTTSATRAQVVVATEAGKRLAYAEVSASGKARLLTASSCVPD
jgi:hypothetical protein